MKEGKKGNMQSPGEDHLLRASAVQMHVANYRLELASIPGENAYLTRFSIPHGVSLCRKAAVLLIFH